MVRRGGARTQVTMRARMVMTMSWSGRRLMKGRMQTGERRRRRRRRRTERRTKRIVTGKSARENRRMPGSTDAEAAGMQGQAVAALH